MNTELINITPLPAFEDNYIWLLHNQVHAIVIDPGDASVVESKLQQLKLELVAILVTHYHTDHIGGVERLINAFHPKVYAPSYGQYQFDHTGLSDNTHLYIEALDMHFDVLWLPGHTQDHIAYLNNHNLFCGDVIFAAGCGRLLDGTAEQMLNALNRLKQLNPSVQLYCAHEYTLHNINFALTLDPNNADLIKRKQETLALRAKGKPSIPSTLAIELKTNPFLRCFDKNIIVHAGSDLTDELSVFAKIRELRNHY